MISLLADGKQKGGKKVSGTLPNVSQAKYIPSMGCIHIFFDVAPSISHIEGSLTKLWNIFPYIYIFSFQYLKNPIHIPLLSLCEPYVLIQGCKVRGSKR